MTLTFSAVLFALFILFRGLQKNIFFLLYVGAMLLSAYFCENHLGWHVRPLTKNAFLLFVLFHIPLINLFTFWAYGRDKHLAQRGKWRIPEIHLHSLEILGGTIGAFIGQRFFHHKNKKKSYMATFFAAVFIQIGVIFWILRYFHFV